MYDYAASVERLADWLRRQAASDWSPTPEAKRLRAVAAKLAKIADTLEAPGLQSLELAFEAPEPDTGPIAVMDTPDTDADGLIARTPVDILGQIHASAWPLKPEESRAGSYKALCRDLRQLAEVARNQASGLPNPKQLSPFIYCADLYLHIRHECGLMEDGFPSLHGEGALVMGFLEVCEQAGQERDLVTLRHRLTEAAQRFDRQAMPDNLSSFLVPARKVGFDEGKRAKST
jgi:hypothetical protein